MNERLKELSDIAYKNHLERNPHSSFGRRSDYDKEFAELIVKECSKINNQFNGYRIGEIDLDIVYKEHFGVE
jgi:hypothetical protein